MKTAMDPHIQYLRIKLARSSFGQFVVGSEGMDGAALLELAIIVPLLFLVFVTVLDFGMLFYREMEVQHAVQAGVEYALGNYSTDPSCQGCASAITNAATVPTSESFIPTVTGPFRGCPSSTGIQQVATGACSGTGTAGYYITISATYAYHPLGLVSAGWLFPNSISSSYGLSASATVRVQ
jgi:Flp pilus assembly protein TadG